MNVTNYHNPRCSKSRETLELIRASGIEPVVIEYLKTPPSREELREIARRMGAPLRSVLRQKGTPYDELGLGDPALSDDALLDAIAVHPVLIERPIVVTPKRALLCRPPERVRELLDPTARTVAAG